MISLILRFMVGGINSQGAKSFPSECALGGKKSDEGPVVPSLFFQPLALAAIEIEPFLAIFSKLELRNRQLSPVSKTVAEL